MKTLIKQYKHPQVNPGLLTNILVKHKRKNIFLVLMQYVIFSFIFILFITNQLNLNIEYYSVFKSLGNIGFIVQLVIQLFVGIIQFFMNNILLLTLLFLLSFVSNIYSIQ